MVTTVLAPASICARDLIREGTRRLAQAGIASARHEAEWILSHLLGLSSLELYLSPVECSSPIVERFFVILQARASGTPLQYLLGETEFFGERFAVTPGVFIPRPETEAVVAAALERLRPQQQRQDAPLRLLDLGTGSGCIAITLARQIPTCVVVGVELSWVALRAARDNVRRHHVAARVQLLQGRWVGPLRGRFDGILANPPYVPSTQVDRLPLDVRQEPRLSLDGGADGLEPLAEIMACAPPLLKRGGLLALECGEEQVAWLLRQAAAAGWVERAQAVTDLAGRPRGVVITKLAGDYRDEELRLR